MRDPSLLLACHAAATWALVGLIWTVQLVHYPLLARVGADGFTTYHGEHLRRMTWVVAPLMVAEAVLAALVLAQPLPAMPAWLPLAGAALVAGIWLSTALVQVPQHGRLAGGPDARTQRRLVAGNWARTAAWSVRGVLATWMLLATA